MAAPILFIVIPCYNEQEALPITAKRLVELTDDMRAKGLISDASRIVLVDDGSKDETWRVIRELHDSDARFEGVKLGTVLCALVNGWLIGRIGQVLESAFEFKDGLGLRALFNR